MTLLGIEIAHALWRNVWRTNAGVWGSQHRGFESTPPQLPELIRLYFDRTVNPWSRIMNSVTQKEYYD